MYAYYCKPLTGEPWLDIDDANLVLDFKFGCDLFTMALRAKRTEEEVEVRLIELGCDPSKPRKLKAKVRMIGH